MKRNLKRRCARPLLITASRARLCSRPGVVEVGGNCAARRARASREIQPVGRHFASEAPRQALDCELTCALKLAASGAPSLGCGNLCEPTHGAPLPSWPLAMGTSGTKSHWRQKPPAPAPPPSHSASPHSRGHPATSHFPLKYAASSTERGSRDVSPRPCCHR